MSTGLESRNVVDYATLSVSSTSVGLASASPAIDNKTKRVIITVETDSVRWRADGTDPTSTEGHILYAGDVLNWLDANYQTLLKAIRFIRVTTDAALKITYLD